MQSSGSDQTFFDLLKADENRAFEWLFRQYFKDLCYVVYRILPDQHLAQDLVQDVFMGLWRRRHELAINTSLGAYLRRSTLNRTLNYLRDNRLAPAEEPGPDIAIQLPDAAANLATQDLQALVNAAIDQLPERCRMVFLLSRYEELSYREIAEKLNIAEKTVENQVVKALRALRAALKDYLPE